jgi:carboxypeptidase Q
VPCVLAQTPAVPVSPETRGAVSKLIGNILVEGKAYDYDRHLADDIGPRLTGSDNYVRAVSWAVEQFNSLGLRNVHTEPFTMPAVWEPEIPATGAIIEPRNQALHIYSVGWSPSTPEEGITGSVMYLNQLLPIEKLTASKDKIVGSIVLIDNSSFGKNPAIGDVIKAFALIDTYNPKAVLMIGSAKGTQNAGSLGLNGELSAFPVAQIGLEDSLLIKRLLDKGPVTASGGAEGVMGSMKTRRDEDVVSEPAIADSGVRVRHTAEKTEAENEEWELQGRHADDEADRDEPEVGDGVFEDVGAIVGPKG